MTQAAATEAATGAPSPAGESHPRHPLIPEDPVDLNGDGSSSSVETQTESEADAPLVAATGFLATAAATSALATAAAAGAPAAARGVTAAATGAHHITTTLYTDRNGHLINELGERVDRIGRLSRRRGVSGSQVNRRFPQIPGGRYESWGGGQIVWRNTSSREVDWWLDPATHRWGQYAPPGYQGHPTHRRGYSVPARDMRRRR